MKSILLSLALAISGPALAAQPAASTPADPGTIAAAERLMDAMDYDGMMSRMADAMVAQLGPTTKAAIEAKLGETVDDELIRRLGVVQEKYFRAQLLGDPKIRHAIALLYSRHFNTTDLDRLALLQKDPVMRKWNELAPALMGDMMPLIVGVVNKDRDAIRAELEQVVADYIAEQDSADES